MKRSILFVALLAFAALPACGGDDDDGGGTPDSTGGGADSAAGADGGTADTAAAALSVTFSTNRTTITPGGGGGGGGGGGNFRISDVAITGGTFALGDPGGDLTGVDGHYHLYVDSTTPAGDYIAVDFEPYTGAESDPIAWPTEGPAAAAGTHNLILSLRNNDHSPLDPVVEATVAITVE